MAPPSKLAKGMAVQQDYHIKVEKHDHEAGELVFAVTMRLRIYREPDPDEPGTPAFLP